MKQMWGEHNEKKVTKNLIGLSFANNDHYPFRLCIHHFILHYICISSGFSLGL